MPRFDHPRHDGQRDLGGAERTDLDPRRTIYTLKVWRTDPLCCPSFEPRGVAAAGPKGCDVASRARQSRYQSGIVNLRIVAQRHHGCRDAGSMGGHCLVGPAVIERGVRETILG
jgi:hypothetical protein